MNLSRNRLAVRHQRGFSLMELLIVIAIIVILAALTMGGLGFMQRNQAVQKCRAQMGMLSTALEEYKLDFGVYPVADDTGAPADQGSNVLFRALYWDSDNNGAAVGADPNQRIYLAELDPASTKQGWSSNPVASLNNTILDPWSSNYRYRSGTNATGQVNPNCINPDFDLWSNGPDGQAGNSAGTDPTSRDNITNWR
jgi:prepilin-type N-terminal cleavage/methylation domain-containing protein